MSTVDARGVSKVFGSFTAVDAADLRVDPGDVVGLLGANGAGKTVLIKMVLGLLAPTSGGVRLFGEPPGIEQRRRIGYVPQNLGLYTDLTLTENLEFRARVFDTEFVPTATSADGQLVGHLPLGLQRRGAFQAALQHRPDLLVLDEPTSGVSPLARSELWDLIRSQADEGTAVLVSTHYMDEAVQTDRLVVMSSGRVVACGTAEAVIGNRQTLVVEADRWADVFAALDRAGLRPLLAGRTIRVRQDHDPGAQRVRETLAESGITAGLRSERATLEEVMVELSV